MTFHSVYVFAIAEPALSSDKRKKKNLFFPPTEQAELRADL